MPLITVEQAKRQLTIDHADYDFEIQEITDDAIGTVETYTGLTLDQADKTQLFNGFTWCLQIDDQPMKAVTAVRYYDENNDIQTLDPALYQVEHKGAFWRVLRADGAVWPETYPKVDAVEVDYTAGWLDGEYPRPLQRAALLIVGQYWEFREELSSGPAVIQIPKGAEHLMDMHKVMR